VDVLFLKRQVIPAAGRPAACLLTSGSKPSPQGSVSVMEDTFARAALSLGDDRSRTNCRSVVFDIQAAADAPPLIVVALWWSSEPVIPSSDGNEECFADTSIYISTNSAETSTTTPNSDRTLVHKQLRFASDGTWKRVMRCPTELQEQEKRRQILLQQRHLKRQRLLQQREDRHRLLAQGTANTSPHPRGQCRMAVDPGGASPCRAVRLDLTT
jgi:hypothetical protein